MPLAILAGIPQNVFRRSVDAPPKVAGWTIRIVAAKSNKVDLSTCWNEVLQSAGSGPDEGAHLLAWHYRQDERPCFYQKLSDRHRLIWPEQKLVWSYGTKAFETVLQDLLYFEEHWRTQLRPGDHVHALVLPEGVFHPDKRFVDVWKEASRARAPSTDLARIRTKLERFKAEQYARIWKDSNELGFDPHGPRHGETGRDWQWKFTFLLPDGFHYDVKHVKGRSFRLRDRNGYQRTFINYANVTAHGIVLGGD